MLKEQTLRRDLRRGEQGVETLSTYTPDGRRLLVRRERQSWVVQCGNGRAARSGLLDVALIEAIRGDHDPEDNRGRVDYAEWVRELADSLERSSS